MTAPDPVPGGNNSRKRTGVLIRDREELKTGSDRKEKGPGNSPSLISMF